MFTPQNSVTYTGQLTEVKQLKRKSDGSRWGTSFKLAQMGSTCEFIVPDKYENTFDYGDIVVVVGHLEQNGYDLRVRVDEVSLSTQQAEQTLSVD